MTRTHHTAFRLRTVLPIAGLVAALAVPAAGARLDPDVRPDELTAARSPADFGLLAGDDKVRSDGLVYADGALRRTDGTPLSSTISGGNDGRYVYADGALRRTDGTPLSSPVAEPTVATASPSSFDWADAWLWAVAGFAAALLLTASLLLARSRHGDTSVAHP